MNKHASTRLGFNLNLKKFNLFDKPNRAWLPSKETIELILAAAVIFVLVYLLISLLVGGWDKEDETAKSYLETLKREIEKADAGGIGVFEIWQPEEGKGKVYLAVYFGDKDKKEILYASGKTLVSVSVSGSSVRPEMNRVLLFPDKVRKNNLCICYLEKAENKICNTCTSFKYPVELKGAEIDKGVILNGQKIKITKPEGEDKYVFEKIE